MKNISVAIVISLVAVFCTFLGYGIGSLESEEQKKLVEEYSNKHIEALQNAFDANMFSSEPYNSYSLSFILYEATLENEPIPIIQEILLNELRSRADGVLSYCASRANSNFRSACEDRVSKALSYTKVDKS